MKEIVDLHERTLARLGDSLPEEGFSFLGSDEEIHNADLLPDDLWDETDGLWQQLDALVAEDFDYHVIFGTLDDPPSFGLSFDEAPAGSIAAGTFDPARSLFDQLRELDWEAQRAMARENAARLRRIMFGIERTTAPLPPAKQFQRLFREEAKDFIREKRRDPSRIHVMYWHEAGGSLSELDFSDGDALRAALPRLVGEGAEIVAVVAGGKPLPVEKIDALKAAAVKVYADQPANLYEHEGADDDAIEVEAVEVESVLPADLSSVGTPAAEPRETGGEVPADDGRG